MRLCDFFVGFLYGFVATTAVWLLVLAIVWKVMQ